MPSYNLQNAASRAQYRAGYEAELAAAQDGTWPRDLNDQMRWQNLPKMPYDPPEVVQAAHRAYVARICKQELDYLDDLERRIRAGSPDLAGYEL